MAELNVSTLTILAATDAEGYRRNDVLARCAFDEIRVEGAGRCLYGYVSSEAGAADGGAGRHWLGTLSQVRPRSDASALLRASLVADGTPDGTADGAEYRIRALTLRLTPYSVRAMIDVGVPLTVVHPPTRTGTPVQSDDLVDDLVSEGAEAP